MKGTISILELRNYIPGNATIIEAGVCDGNDTLEFSVLFPNSKIYGFEPLPHFYEFSKNKLANFKNVELFNLALSDKSEELKFYVSKLNNEYFGSSSIYEPELHKQFHPNIEFNEEITVNAISIDEFTVQHNIPKVDFLWLDLQGAELLTLQGAKNNLKNINCIYTEVSLVETYKNVPLYKDIKEYLHGFGFRVEKEFLPWKDMGNILFIK